MSESNERILVESCRAGWYRIFLLNLSSDSKINYLDSLTKQSDRLMIMVRNPI